VDRTALLATVSSRLAEVVILLTAAGEERLAAYAEDLAQQVEVSALEDKAPPQSAPHWRIGINPKKGTAALLRGALDQFLNFGLESLGEVGAGERVRDIGG